MTKTLCLRKGIPIDTFPQQRFETVASCSELIDLHLSNPENPTLIDEATEAGGGEDEGPGDEGAEEEEPEDLEVYKGVFYDKCHQTWKPCIKVRPSSHKSTNRDTT